MIMNEEQLYFFETCGRQERKKIVLLGFKLCGSGSGSGVWICVFKLVLMAKTFTCFRCYREKESSLRTLFLFK